jgi:hypothetical protein
MTARDPSPMSNKERPMSRLFRSVRWTILAFIRSHDGSTPERPRRGVAGRPR